MNGSAEKQSPLGRHLLNVGKIAGAGAIVATIAFAIAVVGTDGPVSESHADLTWLSPFERSNTDRFEAALDRLGHSEPKEYDLNGNRVYFSTAISRKTPESLLLDYQEEFRRQGLNDRLYREVMTGQARETTEAGLTGSVVPLAISRDRVILAAAIPANHADDAQGLAENFQAAADPTELFRGHRFIEIVRRPDSRHTSIVATWSDEDFDLGAMEPEADSMRGSFDVEVPACPGCVRLTRFAESGHGTGRVDMAFMGPQGIDETLRFYQQAMASRGWQPTDLGATMGAIQEHFDTQTPTGDSLHFSRGSQELSLIFTPDPRTGQTMTVASRNGR